MQNRSCRDTKQLHGPVNAIDLSREMLVIRDMERSIHIISARKDSKGGKKEGETRHNQSYLRLPACNVSSSATHFRTTVTRVTRRLAHDWKYISAFDAMSWQIKKLLFVH